MLRESHLLGFDKVGHLAVVVGPADVETRAGSLRAQPGDDAGLGLLVACINGAYLHAATHEAQQPVVTVHPVVFQVEVEGLVPVSTYARAEKTLPS